jgi:hypothetical protein
MWAEFSTACAPRSGAQNVSQRRARLTITFSYNLSNNLQTFVIVSYLEPHPNTERCDSAKSFEEVLDTRLCTNATTDHSPWYIARHEAELLNQVAENLIVAVSFRGRERIRFTGEKNLDLASSVLCSGGAPYCINMISMQLRST